MLYMDSERQNLQNEGIVPHSLREKMLKDVHEFDTIIKERKPPKHRFPEPGRRNIRLSSITFVTPTETEY
jgi:hypothetical protein